MVDRKAIDRTGIFGAAEADGIVRCDACPVLCRIRPGRAGACHRYANDNGTLIRTDPLVLLRRTVEAGEPVVPFLDASEDWDGGIAPPAQEVFVTAIGAARTLAPEACRARVEKLFSAAAMVRGYEAVYERAVE